MGVLTKALLKVVPACARSLLVFSMGVIASRKTSSTVTHLSVLLFVEKELQTRVREDFTITEKAPTK